MSGKKQQVVIIDDHPMVREWLSQLINKEEDVYKRQVEQTADYRGITSKL